MPRIRPSLVVPCLLCLPLACGDDAGGDDAGGDDATSVAGSDATEAATEPGGADDGNDADDDGPATTAPGGSTGGPGTADDTTATDPGADEDSGTTGAVVPGETIVVAVGNWGHRGMTTDGVRWTEVMNDPPPDGADHTPDLLRGVGYGDGMFVAVGGDANGMVMTTTNGVDWDEDLFPAGTDWLGDVAYLDGIWVAVGGNGVVVRSTDGAATWSENDDRLQWAGRHILAAEGVFVAAGDAGSLAVSPDGLTWSESTDPAGLGFAIAHGLDTFVGFASQWNGAGFDTACVQSPDAQAWSPCPVASASFGSPAGGEGALVVPIDGGWADTSDGATWQTHDGPFPSQLVYADGVWVGLSYHRRWSAASYLGPWDSVENVDGFRDLTVGEIFE